MNIIKRSAAVLSIALIAGLGILGVSKAINAQTQENKAPQENNRQKRGEKKENEKAEKSELNDNDGEAADDNESEADEQREQVALASQATITMEQAQAVALQKVAGEVLKSELEDEDGRIVYGFEIRDASGQTFDVKVDAKTGAFVKMSADDEEKGETSETNEQNETEND